ncbi:MAG: DUF2062 domain-containing protein [Aeromonadaceae bacterium]
MPKKLLQRWMPDPSQLQQHKHLRLLAPWLGNQRLWQLNRRSAAGAFAIGLFMAWIPLPGQMLLAAAAAILWGANLPIAVALVWLTNPLTMPPLFYLAYQCGARLLGMPPVEFQADLSWQWLSSVMTTVGWPFLLGSAVLAVISGLLGYMGIEGLWRISIQRKLKLRRQRLNQV